ncbi:MAG: UrcA family protein [Pseudomonadota bacterium]
MKTLTLTLAAASLGLGGIAAPAFAQDSERKTAAVSFKGLDLNTAEGQEILDRRVESAAKKVCSYRTNGRPTAFTNKSAARDCMVKARASAKAQVAAVIEDQRRGG